MVRYDIELEAASLRAAATVMASANYRGDPGDAAAIARLAKEILAAYYGDGTDADAPPVPVLDII